MTRNDAMKLLKNASFRKFGEFDWEVFSFVKSRDPLVYDSEEFCIVIDGSRAVFLWLDWRQEFLLGQEEIPKLAGQGGS